jgi:hypothetical protein
LDAHGNSRTRAPERVSGALLVLVALGIVAAMVLAKPAPEAPGFIGDLSPRTVSRPLAARPAAALAADLGTPGGRALLSAGFGSDEVVGGRSAARTTSGRSMLTFPLSPDPVGVSVAFLARTAPGVAPHSVTLSINAIDSRPLSIPADWTLLKVTVPEAALASGRNQFELFSPHPGGGIVLDELRLDPLSARVELNVGAPGTRQALTKGWGSDEVIGGRTAARLRPPSAELFVKLRPLASDYVLGVIAMSETDDKSVRLGVHVNAAMPGLLTPGARYGPTFVRVPRSAVLAGENSIKLIVAPNAHFAVDMLTLRPIESSVFVDIGTTEARQNLGAGFSVDEQFELGTSAWSDAPTSRVVVWLKPTAGTYRLSVRASALDALAPLSVVTRLNDKPLGSFMAAPGFHTYDLPIPAEQLRDGQNVLEFRYGATRQPRQADPGSRDARELALRYDWLEIVPGP